MVHVAVALSHQASIIFNVIIHGNKLRKQTWLFLEYDQEMKRNDYNELPKQRLVLILIWLKDKGNETRESS